MIICIFTLILATQEALSASVFQVHKKTRPPVVIPSVSLEERVCAKENEYRDSLLNQLNQNNINEQTLNRHENELGLFYKTANNIQLQNTNNPNLKRVFECRFSPLEMALWYDYWSELRPLELIKCSQELLEDHFNEAQISKANALKQIAFDISQKLASIRALTLPSRGMPEYKEAHLEYDLLSFCIETLEFHNELMLFLLSPLFHSADLNTELKIEFYTYFNDHVNGLRRVVQNFDYYLGSFLCMKYIAPFKLEILSAFSIRRFRETLEKIKEIHIAEKKAQAERLFQEGLEHVVNNELSERLAIISEELEKRKEESEQLKNWVYIEKLRNEKWHEQTEIRIILITPLILITSAAIARILWKNPSNTNYAPPSDKKPSDEPETNLNKPDAQEGNSEVFTQDESNQESNLNSDSKEDTKS